MRLGRCVLCLIVALSAPAAFAGTLNLSTGLDSSGNRITTDLGCDAHWVAIAGPSTACAGSAAQVVMWGDPDWFGGWVGSGPNSDWITSNAGTQQNGSPLPSYMIQFYLASTTGASLSGSWTIDDEGTISLNGNQLNYLPSGYWGSLNPVSASSSDFVPGLNSLVISMTSSDNYLEGVRFEGSVTGEGASFVPEPVSAVMLLTGVGSLFLGLRRRGQRQ